MLKEQIQKDFIEAFKAKNELKSSTLKMIQSAVGNAEIEKRTKASKSSPAGDLAEASRLTEEEVLEIVTREAKKRKESIEAFDKGGRPELAEKEKKELEIISVYLPAQLGEQEVRDLVKKAIEQTGASGIKDLGKVMGVLSAQTKGKADGGTVSALVKEALS